MESSCEQILKWTEKVLNGGAITEEEAKALIRTKDEDTMLLLACADKIRQKFSGRSVDLCAIINARSGACQEDCKFCAQSARGKDLSVPSGGRGHRSGEESEKSRGCPFLWSRQAVTRETRRTLRRSWI